VTIFASDHAVPRKVEAMRSLGAEVRLVPGGYGEAEQAGLEYARESESTWVSPYNDGQVIAGQATVALEMLTQLAEVMPDAHSQPPAAWVVPVGGGGLISGIGIVLSDKVPGSRLYGVQSEASPFFHALFHRGTQEGVVELPSLADGLAGPVEASSVTIPIVRKLVDEILLVTEAEIESAMHYSQQRYGERIEGSAAAALAAVLTAKIPQRPVVVLITGGNTSAL
jgi:threonine dehydratase